jgi:transposase
MGKSITDLLSVTTVGRIWGSTFFKSIRSMLLSALWSPRRSGAISCWSFSLRCRLVGVGLEASGSAHHWARELIKLDHNARMAPPAYVKPYIRRQKNDAADAAATCEAVTRPSMRFVGVIAPQGPRHACELAGLIEACDETILGLTPTQNSSGGKQKLGRISKMGNRNLRKLLVVGAHAVLFHRKPHTDPLRMWAKRLIEKKPFKLVAVALANKMARIAFAIMRGTTVYREIPA